MADDPNKEFLRTLQATFRTEAEEHLSGIVSDIVRLEQSGGAEKGLVERILKTLHTLKGAARAVNLSEMETLCHAAESVFSAIRTSGRVLDAEQFDLLHQTGSVAHQLLDQPSGRARNQAAALIGRLNRLSMDMSAGKTQKDVLSSPPPPAVEALPAEDDDRGIVHEGSDASATSVAVEVPAAVKTDVIRVHGKHLDAIRYQAEELLSVELGLQHHINDLLNLADLMTEQRERLQLAESGAVPAVKKRQTRLSTQLPENDATTDASVERQCRRLASALSRTRRHFVLTRSKLLDALLETALVPFASALDQLPGLVRNLARSRGKQALLDIQDNGIQIDRRILDIVRETLIHLVTNAVDHGIEPVVARLAGGKPAAGTIRIRVAQRSSDRVSVTVADDGAGIDVVGVASAAVSGGSVSGDRLAGLDDRQQLNLALQAGISTTTQVTEVSGRGMGLTIVAEKVAAVGGDLSIDNFPGAGCTFELLLPVRLATLRGLVVRVQGALFVFPLTGMEAVRALKEGDVQTVENRETLLFAGRVVPAIRLGRLLGVGSPDPSTTESVAVIARAAGNTFALLVDEILSEQEVLPKSLGKQLRRVRCITGATQLGDGSLVPILGLEDIARYGLAVGASGSVAAPRFDAATVKRVLVVEDSITSRLLLKHILEGAGYQVETAVDGLDALSRMRQDDFDAVVSDVEMPQLDGLALTERIRANPKTEGLPVILVTSLQSQEEKERGLLAGADAYVVKGAFDQDNLLKTIRRLV